MSNASTKPENVSHLESIKARLRMRAGLFSAVRNYFNRHGFLEVETPVMIKAPAPEEFIEAPSAGDKFLRTSPELQMKQLLAAGYEKIYEIGPCFRQGEFGRRHREEFTMLEWYEVGKDSNYLIGFTHEMLKAAAPQPVVEYAGCKIDLSLPPEIISVDEAYNKYCGKSPDQTLQDGDFDELMVTLVEPELGKDRATFLSGYPAERAALAEIGENGRAMRWELYLGGLEIANAYTELTDPVEQRKRFEEAKVARDEANNTPYPEPEEFYKALDYGLPQSTGCALGLDRLVMVFTNAKDIDQARYNLPLR